MDYLSRDFWNESGCRCRITPIAVSPVTGGLETTPNFPYAMVSVRKSNFGLFRSPRKDSTVHRPEIMVNPHQKCHS